MKYYELDFLSFSICSEYLANNKLRIPNAIENIALNNKAKMDNIIKMIEMININVDIIFSLNIY